MEEVNMDKRRKPFTQDELGDLDLLAQWAADGAVSRAKAIKAAVHGFINELSDEYDAAPQSSKFRLQTDDEVMAVLAALKRKPASVLSAIEGWETLTSDEQAEVISETQKLAALVPHLV
jgi:hypothetical protein